MFCFLTIALPGIQGGIRVPDKRLQDLPEPAGRDKAGI